MDENQREENSTNTSPVEDAANANPAGGSAQTETAASQSAPFQYESTVEVPKEPQNPARMFTGIVGAILGILIGMVLWVVVYQLGFIASIVGIVMTVCAFKGFELLGGGYIPTLGIIICLVMEVVAIFLAHNIAISISITSEFSEISFQTAFQKLIPQIMVDSELAVDYWKDLLFGYGLALLGIIPMVRERMTQRKQQAQ